MVRYVNATKARKYAASRGDSSVNCARCTAAGVLNLTIGSSVFSTDQVKPTRGVYNLALGTDTGEQGKNIINFVTGITERLAQEFDEPSLLAAETWMKRKPDKTVFAVLAIGSVVSDSIRYRTGCCHWLNAILAGGTIRYFDFQTMRQCVEPRKHFPGSLNPSTSTKPFVGIITQIADIKMSAVVSTKQSDLKKLDEDERKKDRAIARELQSPRQAGSFNANVQLKVIAFFKKSGKQSRSTHSRMHRGRSARK